MGMLQLSVLRVFQAILSDKAFRKQEGSGEVVRLATRVTRNLCARLVPDNQYPEGMCGLCSQELPAWAATRLTCSHDQPNPQRERAGRASCSALTYGLVLVTRPEICPAWVLHHPSGCRHRTAAN